MLTSIAGHLPREPSRRRDSRWLDSFLQSLSRTSTCFRTSSGSVVNSMAYVFRKSKPRILCLHGGGTSALIFTIQTRKVQWALNQHFEFVFIDAPFESGPGPGVLPVFEDAGPYYRWARWYEDERGERLRDLIKATLEERGGPWIGVMGFSQGGRMAAGLLWEQEQNKLHELVPGVEFKFGIFVGSGYPILHLAHGPKGKFYEREHKNWDEKYAESIHIPSIHIHGLQDGVLPMARLLTKCFDSKTVRVFEYEIGHLMPPEKEQNDELAQAVLEAYRASGGKIDSQTSNVNVEAIGDQASDVTEETTQIHA